MFGSKFRKSAIIPLVEICVRKIHISKHLIQGNATIVLVKISFQALPIMSYKHGCCTLYTKTADKVNSQAGWIQFVILSSFIQPCKVCDTHIRAMFSYQWICISVHPVLRFSQPPHTAQLGELDHLQLRNAVVSCLFFQLADWTVKEQQQTYEVIPLFTLLFIPISMFLACTFACSTHDWLPIQPHPLPV